MKVLLRDSQTGLYWGGLGLWVNNPERALAFPTIPAAGQGAGHCGEEDVDVVLKFDEPECELALNPAYCRTPLDRAVSHKARFDLIFSRGSC